VRRGLLTAASKPAEGAAGICLLANTAPVVECCSRIGLPIILLAKRKTTEAAHGWKASTATAGAGSERAALARREQALHEWCNTRVEGNERGDDRRGWL